MLFPKDAGQPKADGTPAGPGDDCSPKQLTSAGMPFHEGDLGGSFLPGRTPKISAKFAKCKSRHLPTNYISTLASKNKHADTGETHPEGSMAAYLQCLAPNVKRLPYRTMFYKRQES